ncbi:hypothetical protein [Paenibacillus sp. IHBB 10380]|uniref:hypothetical protein n=1 Tax=Paenibacillus sp. IHBB 10380 TaxID=1566358 RepID=UPI0005CF96AB|nr:hypothetical protein [Paenibacillus sp. IHBB 10380]
MHKRRKTYAAVLLTTVLLSQSMAYEAYAASAGTSPVAKSTKAVFNLDKLGSIVLKSNVSVKLMDINISEQPSGNILTYTLRYSNGSGSNVSLIDYFSKVTTTGGTTVQGSPITSDATKESVPSKSGQTVTYYVNIGKATKVTGAKVSIFGWDFNSADYQKRLGVFTVPTNYSMVAAKGQSKKITMNNLPITTKAESLQKIQINGKVYMRIGISLTNSDTKVLSDPGFKAYLASASGSVFELTLDDASSGYKVQPQEKKMIYYLAEIPSYIKTDNMTLQFAEEDSTLKINLPVITFTLPALTASDSAVADYAVKKISINHNTVETQLKSASVYSENDTAKWNLLFRIKNLGNKSVALPAYELAIKAAEGYSIPVDTKALANLTLKPLEEKIIELSADVRLDLNQSKLMLQLTEPAATDKIIFPTAYYQIPYSQESNNRLGLENMLENRHGTFGVKIDSIQRLPWADEDQIVAKISIRNTKSTTVKLPALKALVKAGLSDLSSTTQIVAKNAQTSLAPHETAEIYVITKVPYSSSIKQLRIVLQETSGDDVTNFLTLNTSLLNNVMNTVVAGGSFPIDFTGKKAEIRERRTTVYNGSSSNMMYTELEMNSKEPRKSEQAQLVAYYRTPENEYYEAEVSQSSKATSPNGKNVVTVWSKIPLSVNTSELVLHIGEGVADGKLTAIGGKSTGYINTVRLSLNTAGVTPQSNLRSVELFPYSLSLTNVVGTVREGEDTLDTVVTYNLSKNEAYEAGEYEHKLVLEIIDPNGQSMEKTLTLGTDLFIGNNKSYATTFKSNLYKKLRGGGIRMNLYDEFQGQRMLLGSQSYSLTYEELPTTSTDGTGSAGS